jgi:hypothetical protein
VCPLDIPTFRTLAPLRPCMRIREVIKAIPIFVLCWALVLSAEATTIDANRLINDDHTDNNSKASKDNKDNKDNKEKEKSDKAAKEDSPKGEGVGETDEERKRAEQAREKILPSGSAIIVSDRPLTGPFSSPQLRGTRIFLPVVTIARALGDKATVNPTARTVEVQRQTGVQAEFNASLSQVREDGSVILVVSSTADIIFSPNPEELMLPVEIISALLDVSIVVDEQARAVRVFRGSPPQSSVRTGTQHAAWELYQIDYSYNLSMYSNSFYQNFTLNSNGRIGDGRFIVATSFDGGTGQSPLVFRRGSFAYDAPDGKKLVAGDFGTGTDLSFLSSTLRGVLAEQAVGGLRLTAMAGRAASGLPGDAITPGLTTPQTESVSRRGLTFDTNVLAAYASFGPSAHTGAGLGSLLFSSGAMYFSGPQTSGGMATASMKYNSRHHLFQGDVALGNYSGMTFDGRKVEGSAPVLDVSEVFNITDRFTLQGRISHISPDFLSPQSAGAFSPVDLVQGGFSWRPLHWVGTSVTGSKTTRLDRDDQTDRSVTATVSLTPGRFFPSIIITHTQTDTDPGKGSAYTLMNVTKEFRSWRLFGNFTRIRNAPVISPTFKTAQPQTPPSVNTTAGAVIKVNQSNIIQASQSVGSGGSLGGDFDWMTSRLFSKRVSFGAGIGYSYSSSRLSFTERFSAAVELPGQHILQTSYVQTENGPQIIVQLRGQLFRSKRAESAAYASIAELRSFGAFYGKVYQDVNLNGRFDAGVDQPQTGVQVRVDGNFYAVTDKNGDFRVDNVKAGEHNVYMDLLSVRADLTLLDSPQRLAVLRQGNDSIVDFRLVRTGRVKGVVWMDSDGNGRLDEGETLLSDVRVVTASGRDTLTDSDGVFILGDLPPGEHVLLIDEKTLPDNTQSAAGSIQVHVKAGSETGGVILPVINKPSQVNVKRFPASD